MRALAVRKDSLDEGKRTVDLVFATESPAPMWHWDLGDYDEILDCTEDSCDLSRLRLGGALLSEHDRSKQIGVIESASFANGQGIATARFSTSPLGEQEFQDVKAGIRRNFSVSYQVKELTAERLSEDEGNLYRATKWEPLEISLVSVPADKNCQAIRSAQASNDNSRTSPATLRIPETLTLSDTMKRSLPSFFHIAETGGATGSSGQSAVTQTIDPAEMERQVNARLAEREKAITANRKLLRETATGLRECNIEFPDSLLESALDNNDAPDVFQRAAMDSHRKNKGARQQQPTQSGHGGSGIEIVREMPKNLRSIGAQIIGDEAYTKARGTSRRAMEIKIADAVNFRATLLTTTTTGFTPTLQPSAPVLLGVQQPTVADLMPQMVTNLASYPYWQEDTLTPAATSVAEEGLKPEASWDLSQQTAPVVKIAVIGRVSDEAFDDMPSMEGYVNTRLRYMVEIEEDDQLLNGNGGGDMTGIINTGSVQTQAKSSDTAPDAIRKAITKVQSTGFFAPDGIVVHPNDWEQLCLLKDTAGQYLAGGPFYGPYGNGEFMNFMKFWGLRVVVTTACPEGTAVVGAWSIGATVLRKKGLTIDTTNSDGDDFKYNRIAIRAEQRSGLVVWRPKAFCLVTGI